MRECERGVPYNAQLFSYGSSDLCIGKTFRTGGGGREEVDRG